MNALVGLILILIQFLSNLHACESNETYCDDVDLNRNSALATNVTHRKYDYLYSNLRVYFLKWYLPLVVGVGTFGTVFCLVFLFLSRLFPANMLLWLVSICVGDFLILVMEGVWMLLKVWLNYDIRDINNVACVLHTSFSNYLYYWSAYMQCMLSMQRAYLIIRPLRARGNGPNMKWLIFIWISISVLLVIPMLPYSLYWRVIDGDCDPPRESLFRITTLSDFIIWSLIPLIGMTSATAIICWNIFRIRRSFQSGSIPALSQNTSGQSTFTYLCPPTRSSLPNRMSTIERGRLFNPTVTGSQNRLVSMLSQHAIRTSAVNLRSTPNRLNKAPTFTDNTVTFARPISVIQNSQGQRHGATDNAGHVTRLLICMNIWYMISTYPLMIYLMFLNFIFKDMDRDIHKFMYYLSRSLCFLNSCSNWIFYCASGRLFRQRIKQICRRFVRRLLSHSGSQSSGFNDNQVNLGRNATIAMRDRYTMVGINDTWGRRRSWLPRKVLSADNLHLNVNNSPGYLSRPGACSVRSSETRSRFTTFMHRFFHICHAFQCHCICTKPLPFVVHSIPSVSQMGEDETLDSLSHGTAFCPRTTVASEHVCECEACCTGFCCWKFWWYGFSGGLMKKESVFTTGTTKDRSKGQSFVLSSSSSSLYFHSELAKQNSQLRARSACVQCSFNHHNQHQHNQNHCSRKQQIHLRHPHSHSHHHHHHHRTRHAQSDNRMCDFEPTSSCGRDSKIWCLPENKLQHESKMIRTKHELYGSAPSSLIHPSHGCMTTINARPQAKMGTELQVTTTTYHTHQKTTGCNTNPTNAIGNTNATTTTNNTVNTNPMCYCYMSSLGKRRYHYHFCKLHERRGEQRSEAVADWRWASHHPFALSPLHSAQSEGRILRALEGNRDEFISLPPARQQSANIISQSSSH